MKKKIVFILPHLNGGGAERVTLNYLRSIDRDKFNIILIVFDATSDLLHLVPEDIEFINLATIKVSKSFFKLTAILKKLKPNYVFTSHYTVAFLLSISKKLLPKFQHLARIPGSPKSELEHKYYSNFKRTLFGYGLRSAQINIAQTNEMLEEAINIFKLKRNNCTVLSNPLDTNLIDASIENSKQVFDKNKYNIVASGRLHSVKGYDILIRAFKLICDSHRNIHLHILGSDKGMRDQLVKLVALLSLEDKITFYGFVKNPYPYYNQCDLFVLSSIHEGFPNALLENFYLNTPLVSTRCAKIVENIIKEGENGYLCEVNNIDSLYKSIRNAMRLERNKISTSSFKNSELNNLIN